jgi:predicted RNase H-like HicB family nuclease
MQKIEFVARLPFALAKRKNHFLASCRILDIHSQGETEKKAKENLAEALFLFFISCIQRNTLDAVLKECGFELGNKIIGKTTRTKYIDIPIPFVA